MSTIYSKNRLPKTSVVFNEKAYAKNEDYAVIKPAICLLKFLCHERYEMLFQTVSIATCNFI